MSARMGANMNEPKNGRTTRVQFRLGGETFSTGVEDSHGSSLCHGMCKKGRAKIFRSHAPVETRLGGGSRVPALGNSSLTLMPASSSLTGEAMMNSSSTARLPDRRSGTRSNTALGSSGTEFNSSLRMSSFTCGLPEITSPHRRHGGSSTTFPSSSASHHNNAVQPSCHLGERAPPARGSSGLAPHVNLNQLVLRSNGAYARASSDDFEVINTSNDLVPLLGTSWTSPTPRASVFGAELLGASSHRGSPVGMSRSFNGADEEPEDRNSGDLYESVPQITMLDVVNEDSGNDDANETASPLNAPPSSGRVRQFGRQHSSREELCAEANPLHDTKNTASLTRFPSNYQRLPSAYLDSLTAEPPRGILHTKMRGKVKRRHQTQRDTDDPLDLGVSPTEQEMINSQSEWAGWLKSGTDLSKYI